MWQACGQRVKHTMTNVLSVYLTSNSTDNSFILYNNSVNKYNNSVNKLNTIEHHTGTACIGTKRRVHSQICLHSNLSISIKATQGSEIYWPSWTGDYVIQKQHLCTLQTISSQLSPILNDRFNVHTILNVHKQSNLHKIPPVHTGHLYLKSNLFIKTIYTYRPVIHKGHLYIKFNIFIKAISKGQHRMLPLCCFL